VSARRRPPTAIIGAGRLARAVGPAALRAGYPIVSVTSRSLASARRLSKRLRGSRAVTRPAEAVRRARLVLLAVPDREVASVTRELAGSVDGGWERRIVLHHAGSLGVEPLSPVARRGAGVGVLHPLQCLGMAEVATAVLPGSRARIEGDRRGRAAARRLAEDLGLVPLPMPSRLKPSDRVAYHTAASLVSNDVVALLSLASDLLESIGVPRSKALAALLPLTRGTLSHAEAGGLEGALTGPVARGDVETTAAQLRSLSRRSRAGADAHRLLALRLLALAEDQGRLDPARRRELRRLLDKRRS
jgi:predicted short-subunit dehydrogenase-like oxidoreductase (DUF2520 family)